ncbi:MAG: hypothetical protein E7642_02415 [Ruminococcaceae bacterium]|nr:hypothetical protein [Oscillospiraceae bacterium]
MATQDIIKKHLDFLIYQYGFEFEYVCNEGEHFIFKNQWGYFKYYQWSQFGEEEFSVKIGSNFRTIKLYEEYPQIVGQFNQNHKGFKWFFKDSRDDFWLMVAAIIKDEINLKNSIFGLPLG